MNYYDIVWCYSIPRRFQVISIAITNLGKINLRHPRNLIILGTAFMIGLLFDEEAVLNELTFRNFRIQRILYVHYTYSIRTLYVHYTYIIRTLYVHYTYIIRTLYVHYTYIIRTLYVHYTYIIRTLYVHYTYIIRTLYVHYTYIIRTL